MTLKPAEILNRLKAKREDFTAFDQSARVVLEQYREALQRAAASDPGDLMQRLKGYPLGDRGAEILEPGEGSDAWVIPSHLVWENREESFDWVRDRITGITTFAVDGSQIYPGKDLSIPIALVQIGWFENPHRPGDRFDKDVELDVMTPVDLQISTSSDPVDRKVNMHRFALETRRLIQYIEAHANTQDCLVFFDGSLVVTFADAFDEQTRCHYMGCVVKLLRASEACRVPLVAYIDTSYATDLTLMLQRLYPRLPETAAIHDAPLLGRLMQWGDRTPLFRCRRPGILADYPDGLSSRIAFTYLKAHEGAPVRLELPLWVYEAGIHHTILDWVRCEIIIGNGYPYAIETADQTAVIQAQDRHLFYRIFQDWADSEHLNLHLSRKMVSKARRR